MEAICLCIVCGLPHSASWVSKSCLHPQNIWFCLLIPAIYPGPSSAPAITSVSASTLTSATVLWKRLDCMYRNGLITGHILRYNSESGMPHFIDTQNATSSYQLKGLTACTRYTLRIAAENEAGIGPFSDPKSFNTKVPGMLVVGYE